MGREKITANITLFRIHPSKVQLFHTDMIIRAGYAWAWWTREGVVASREGGSHTHPPGSWQLLFNDRPAYLHKRNQEI